MSSAEDSNDEVIVVKIEKGHNNNERDQERRKYCKRKRSNSPSSSRSQSLLSNRKSCHMDQLKCKSEYLELLSGSLQDRSYLNANDHDIISSVFKNLSAIDSSLSPVLSTERNSPSIRVEKETDFINDTENMKIKKSMKNREAEYHVDRSGIDTVGRDLYKYLLDLGLTCQLTSDIIQVYNRPRDNATGTMNEGDTTMSGSDGVASDINYGCPADALVHREDQQPPGATSILDDVIDGTLLDPLAIENISEHDPRISHTKLLLRQTQNHDSKVLETAHKRTLPTDDILNVWESTVTEVVETHLRLYLIHKDITVDEYKSILKRAVAKILVSGATKIEMDKIATFIHSYVTMTVKSRGLKNI